TSPTTTSPRCASKRHGDGTSSASRPVQRSRGRRAAAAVSGNAKGGRPGRSLRAGCPLWVKSRHSAKSDQCPLYPQKRTLELSVEMSALCQKRTSEHRQLICAKCAREKSLYFVPLTAVR